MINKRLRIKKLDFKTIFCIMQGQSIFSLFDGKLQLYQVIYSTLALKNFKDKMDIDEEEIESPHLRRVV